MIEEGQLRSHLIKFIEGKLTLDEFEDQFVSASWNMHKDSSESAIALASAVGLCLAEHSSGHLSDSELLDELRPLATVFTMQISFGPVVSTVAQGRPNNIAVEVAPQMFMFPVRWDPSREATAYQGATVRVDTSRAVVLA